MKILFYVLTAFTLLALYVWYQWNYPNFSWHQKMVVEVEIPEGTVSGSSVIAVHKHKRSGAFVLPAARGVFTDIEGEAVVVEVAPGKYLFALLKGAGSLARETFGVNNQPIEQIYDALRSATGPKEVPRTRHYPLLVTFEDIDNPASVEKVDPDDLAGSFGPGVSLKRITLVITDEQVTRGKVENVLGWLETHSGYFSGEIYLDHEHPEKNLTISEISRGK